MTRVLCFGDSTTFGFTDSAGGWTSRLHNDLANIYIDKRNNPMHEVINLGISGDMVADVKARIKHEAAARIPNGGVIVLAIGTNDSQYYRDTSRVEFEIDEFSENLRQLVRTTQKLTDKCIVLGLFPCEDAKMQPMPWAKTSESYSNQRLSMFNAEIGTICSELDVLFIDMFDDVLKLNYKGYLHDGIHPNSVGHQYIADRINKEVARLANSYQ